MLRPLREAQVSYAARDATLLLPLLRSLATEAEGLRADPAAGPRLAELPAEMRRLLHRVRHYRTPDTNPVLEKVRNLGLGEAAVEKARKLTELRRRWGNQGDVAAVMELGNRWIVARLEHPPRSREALERCMPNPRFRRARLDALWEVLGEP
jgi:ribonuclease D